MLIAKPYKIAIVDDSSSMRVILSEICRRNPDFEVYTFASGTEAIEAVAREKIRVVLVDINMPEMFGDDLLRSCMAMKLGIQVYVVTGADSITIADRCMNVGARGIIPKPKLEEGCLRALAESAQYFERWNETLLYFLKHKKGA